MGKTTFVNRVDIDWTRETQRMQRWYFSLFLKMGGNLAVTLELFYQYDSIFK